MPTTSGPARSTPRPRCTTRRRTSRLEDDRGHRARRDLHRVGLRPAVDSVRPLAPDITLQHKLDTAVLLTDTRVRVDRHHRLPGPGLQHTVIAPAATATTAVIVAVPRRASRRVPLRRRAMIEKSAHAGRLLRRRTADTATVELRLDRHRAALDQHREDLRRAEARCRPRRRTTANTLISSTRPRTSTPSRSSTPSPTRSASPPPPQITVVQLPARRGPRGGGRRPTRPVSRPVPSTTDPTLAADQLVAYHAAGGLRRGHRRRVRPAWNLYMFTWSDQDPVPVTAVPDRDHASSTPPRSGPSTAGLRPHPASPTPVPRSWSLPDQGQPVQLLRPVRGGAGPGGRRPDGPGQRPDRAGRDPLVLEPQGSLHRLLRQPWRWLQDADLAATCSSRRA